MADFTFEIKEHFGDLLRKPDGWTKEINLVSWNGGEDRFDIREWAPDHRKMSRGITLTASEMHRLVNAMESRV